MTTPEKQESHGDPEQALREIQRKLQIIARDYSAGKLNSAQFNALYRHYNEQATVIRHMLRQNPGGDAWRAAASSGRTTFLRDQFEARIMFYVVFRHGDRQPLVAGGKLPQKVAEQVHKLLRSLWTMERPRTGLARKSLGDGVWLLLVVGEYSLTISIYHMQPSSEQATRVRDLHAEFERLNRAALERRLAPNRMIFPQRALLE